MPAEYLIRIDDVCPTMNWDVWEQIERMMLDAGVKPILAVVPNNSDPTLVVGPPAAEFWERVRTWQGRGWTIGLHGYQHRYVTSSSGMLSVWPKSEFAGLSLDEQAEKIKQGLEIFRRERVHAEVWVAPGHSFDGTTLDVLREQGLEWISDGLYLFPNRDDRGLLWVPQQIWRFYNLPWGVWTVCLHANGWTAKELVQFGKDLSSYRDRIVSFAEVLADYGQRPRTWFDRGFSIVYGLALRVRRLQRWLQRRRASAGQREAVFHSSAPRASNPTGQRGLAPPCS